MADVSSAVGGWNDRLDKAVKSFLGAGGVIVDRHDKGMAGRSTSGVEAGMIGTALEYLTWALEEGVLDDSLGLVALNAAGKVVGALTGHLNRTQEQMEAENLVELPGKFTDVVALGSLGEVAGAGTCLLLVAAQMAVLRGEAALVISSTEEAGPFYSALGCELLGEAFEDGYDSFDLFGWRGAKLSEVATTAFYLGLKVSPMVVLESKSKGL